MEFFATCPGGFEHLLQDELRSLGMGQARALKGQVSFTGELCDAYRACLWSRLASRVTLVLGRIDAADADALYEGISDIDWTVHLVPGSTFSIDAHGTNAQLRNTQFVALRAKDAICDQMLARTGTRPETDTERPDVEIVVRLSRERATVGINLSGTPLFRRGYEPSRATRMAVPPLRADYAAAMLAAGGWFRRCREAGHGGAEPVLASLFFGSGTILVEAAEQALDRAPGLTRARWGFERWAGHDATVWSELLAEARGRVEDAAGRDVRLIALTSGRDSGHLPTQLLRAAGMPDVEPEYVGAREAGSALGGSDALLACDLSWLSPDEVAAEAAALADLSSASSALAGTGSIVCLTRDDLADAAIGAKPSGSIATVLGRDEAQVRTYDAAALLSSRPTVSLADASGVQQELPVFVPASDQFASRLRKVWRERRRWAKREDVSCFRIYDADLPDYAVTIDLFEGSEILGRHDGKRGRWLQIYEYQAPREVDPALARERLLDVLAIAPTILGIPAENVFVHVRSHGRGGSQYAAEGAGTPVRSRRRPAGARPGYVPLPPGAHLVDEGGLTFEVNFSARLDCGLFLDHRETRSLIRELMKKTEGSKRFLNLFAYTGTATCYAADGGARHTTTVDMSAPSLEWARRNMERNGFAGRDHEYVRADVIDWVTEQRRSRNRWDLVFCDVPTFSNSKGMRHGSWDVQRDHAELLIGVSRLLTRGGTCVFSCNLRSFKPDVDKLAQAGVSIEDITDQTIPEDFRRNRKIHHCYLVRRT